MWVEPCERPADYYGVWQPPRKPKSCTPGPATRTSTVSRLLKAFRSASFGVLIDFATGEREQKKQKREKESEKKKREREEPRGEKRQRRESGGFFVIYIYILVFFYLRDFNCFEKPLVAGGPCSSKQGSAGSFSFLFENLRGQ
ncbi:hypothetical protein BSKO_09186 [Bryopsis sp. KO-2023]|nr:hypothetical protein BSKO_09186 [Bryopsis sp. KO-2023]